MRLLIGRTFRALKALTLDHVTEDWLVEEFSSLLFHIHQRFSLDFNLCRNQIDPFSKSLRITHCLLDHLVGLLNLILIIAFLTIYCGKKRCFR